MALSGITLSALAVAAALAYLLVRFPHLAGMIDRPNDRSLHDAPVPRTGGIAVLTGLCSGVLGAAWLVGLPVRWWWVAAALFAVALVSLRDDMGSVGALERLAVHILASVLLVTGGITWSHLDLPGSTVALAPWVAVVLTVLYVVWMINLYNFMDGMDGFAGGMAVIGFGALAVFGILGEDYAFAAVNLATAAAAAGFLLLNFPPARMFLGDVGSTTLGLLAAAWSLEGSRRGLFPLWAAWLVFSPFIVDASWTLLRRLIKGERVWQAHRSHHYQRLVLAGWSHKKTVLAAYVLMIACASTALATRGMSSADQWLLVGGWAVVYGLIGVKTRLIERRAGRAAS